MEDLSDREENWRPVVGFEDCYEVSNLGRVRSVDRMVVARRSGRSDSIFPVQGALLKLGTHPGGYLDVRLSRTQANGKNTGRMFFVHYLVAAAFIGPRRSGVHINHIDGDPKNNRLENLEYVSPKENCLHRARILKKNVGEKHPASKLTERDVRQICAELRDGQPMKAIAERFAVTVTTLSDIAHGRHWLHMPEVSDLAAWWACQPHCQSKLSRVDIEQICELIRTETITLSDIARFFKVAPGQISAILNGVHHSHLPCVQDLMAWHRDRLAKHGRST